MTFDEVGAPARLSGGPPPATNIPVVHTLHMAIQSTFDLEQVSMTSMTFDEVGAPARLSGGPPPATNIPVVHTLHMAIQSTFDLEQEEPRKKV